MKSKFSKFLNRQIILVCSIILLLFVPSIVLPMSVLETRKGALLEKTSNAYLHLKLSEIAAEQNDWALSQTEFETARLILNRDKHRMTAGFLSYVEAVSRKAYAERSINEEIAYWEEMLAKQPGYKDGYLKLALLNYQLNEQNKAIFFWQKAWLLDPNAEEVVKVGEFLGVD